MLQQDTEKIIQQDIEHDTVNVHKQLRASKRDIVANLCLDLSRNNINDFLDNVALYNEYHRKIGALLPLVLFKEKLQQYGLKQFIRLQLFNLRYDSLLSNVLDRIAR